MSAPKIVSDTQDAAAAAATTPAPATNEPATSAGVTSAVAAAEVVADGIATAGAAAASAVAVATKLDASAALLPSAEMAEVSELAESGETLAWPADASVPLENVLQALLLGAEAPLSLDALLRLLGDEFNCGRAELRLALGRLATRLSGSALELREVASGWRLQVRGEYGPWVARLWQEKPPRLSRALLETLALIVYRQPITRGEIEDIRGVAVSSNILRGLLERGWVREVGHKEVPGRPALLATTPQFLDDFNLKSLDQLPALPEVRDLAQLEAALARLAPEAVAEAVAQDDPAAAPYDAATDAETDSETGNDAAAAAAVADTVAATPAAADSNDR